jgi:hypothetical protein
MAAIAIVHGVGRTFDVSPGPGLAFLDAANQFVHFAFDELHVVMRQPRQDLFDFALGDVPVSIGDQCAHIFLGLICRATQRGQILGCISCAENANGNSFRQIKDFAAFGFSDGI